MKQSWHLLPEDLGHSQTRLRGQRPDGLGDYDFKLRALGNDPTGHPVHHGHHGHTVHHGGLDDMMI